MSVIWGSVATSAHGEFEVMSDAQEPKSTTNVLQILGAPSSLTYVCCALSQTMADTIHGDHFLIPNGVPGRRQKPLGDARPNKSEAHCADLRLPV